MLRSKMKPKLKSKKDPIEIRLDALIRLLSDVLIFQYKVNKNTIYKSLHDLGLTPSEIGQIFGKDRSAIGSELTKMKNPNNKNDD